METPPLPPATPDITRPCPHCGERCWAEVPAGTSARFLVIYPWSWCPTCHDGQVADCNAYGVSHFAMADSAVRVRDDPKAAELRAKVSRLLPGPGVKIEAAVASGGYFARAVRGDESVVLAGRHDINESAWVSDDATLGS